MVGNPWLNNDELVLKAIIGHETMGMLAHSVPSGDKTGTIPRKWQFIVSPEIEAGTHYMWRVLLLYLSTNSSLAVLVTSAGGDIYPVVLRDLEWYEEQISIYHSRQGTGYAPIKKQMDDLHR